MADKNPGGYRARLELHDSSARAGRQRDLAPKRLAKGQCLVCGAFREDEEPPTVHRTGCGAVSKEEGVVGR